MSDVKLHSSPSLSLSRGVGVTLQPGQARTLRVPAAGLLRVTRGALWVTRHGARAQPAPDDVYVAAGQPLALRAGESVVIEPIHRGGEPAGPVAPAAFAGSRPPGAAPARCARSRIAWVPGCTARTFARDAT